MIIIDSSITIKVAIGNVYDWKVFFIFFRTIYNDDDRLIFATLQWAYIQSLYCGYFVCLAFCYFEFWIKKQMRKNRLFGFVWTGLNISCRGPLLVEDKAISRIWQFSIVIDPMDCLHPRPQKKNHHHSMTMTFWLGEGGCIRYSFRSSGRMNKKKKVKATEVIPPQKKILFCRKQKITKQKKLTKTKTKTKGQCRSF